jgi:N-acetylglucosaminyl-diphospho-decaprenol L-rhamnosyltransferase
MSMLDWAVITVTYNNADELKRCWPNALPPELLWIVVDNASKDESASVARDMGAHVIKMPKNVGFSAGCNVGMRACDRELLLFANPDLQIVADDLAELEVSVRKGQGLSAPRLMNADGSRQPNVRGVPYVINKLAARGLKLPGADLNSYLWPKPERVAWLMGAAVATTRASMLSVGGWSERYFVYFEDHELGLAYHARELPVQCVESVRWVHSWAREPVKGTIRRKLRAIVLEIVSGGRFYWQHPGLVFGREKPVTNNRAVS